MSNSVYVMGNEARSGKSVVSLGLMETLTRLGKKVCFFRPIVNAERGGEPDKDLRLMRDRYGIELAISDSYCYTLGEAREMLGADQEGELFEGILAQHRKLGERFDFVLSEGSDFTEFSSVFEFDINVAIAKHLQSPLLLVINGHERSEALIGNALRMVCEELEDERCTLVAAVVNRANCADLGALARRVKASSALEIPIYAIPEEPALMRPTVGEIARHLGAELLFGADKLDTPTRGYVVAAMQLGGFLENFSDGELVITPGDRADIIIGCMAAMGTVNRPRPSALVLTVGKRPEESVCALIESLAAPIPVLAVAEDTFHTALKLTELSAAIQPEDHRKIARSLELFDKHVDAAELAETIADSRSEVVTPKMFEYELMERAKADPQHIVLPEGSEPRVLRAVEILRRREVVNITLLGSESEIRTKAAELGVELGDTAIIDPESSPLREDFAKTYCELRAHKRVPMSAALDVMRDVSYFGTMMVYKGAVDGMVSGSAHTTAHTIRPSFEFIKTRPGIKTVSSVFFMCLADKVLVYGDCAVVPNPTAAQLAEIAVSAAGTAQTFGVEPRVALLSYSTGSSGSGDDVEKVREATRLARELAPDLLLEGPIQYDAAVDPGVAEKKMPATPSLAARRSLCFRISIPETTPTRPFSALPVPSLWAQCYRA